jgi:hypothetical protein
VRNLVRNLLVHSGAYVLPLAKRNEAPSLKRGTQIMRKSAFVSTLLALVGCTPVTQTATAPLPVARYDYSASSPCEATGKAKLTIAVVSPRWQQRSQGMNGATNTTASTFGTPKVLLDVGPAMRSDFLELLTCRGYLTKGPFDSFEAMVFPDREGSQLLLEPELQIQFSIDKADLMTKGLIFGTLSPTPPNSSGNIVGTASVGGRVTLSLKEPVTNTRMWARSIELPAEAFDFTSEKEYSSAISADRLRGLAANDDGLRRQLQPRLEAMYQSVFKTAEGYLDRQELTSIAKQAGDVRKKAAIGVPPE